MIISVQAVLSRSSVFFSKFTEVGKLFGHHALNLKLNKPFLCMNLKVLAGLDHKNNTYCREESIHVFHHSRPVLQQATCISCTLNFVQQVISTLVGVSSSIPSKKT